MSLSFAQKADTPASLAVAANHIVQIFLEPGIWLPSSMDEEYDLPGRTVIVSGHATYSNFRRFRVDVKTDFDAG